MPMDSASPCLLPLLDGSLLQNAKRQLERVHRAPAILLKKEAEEALKAGPFQVTDKKELPPSGNLHDYYSRASYYWPNPHTEDGLPWVCRDGESNPTARDSDQGRLMGLSTAVETLALAHFFFEDSRYAEKAIELLDAFFVNPETRMNPHLKYSQSIPGIWEGSGWGIVSTRLLIPVADSIALLESAGVLSQRTLDLLKGWMTTYLLWLLESEEGREASNKPNNHATIYDCQVVALARLTGQDYIAERVLREVPARRIDFQLEQTGKQMWEIARTRAFGYSVGNLDHLIDLGLMARRYDIDLFTYASPDGRSIQRSLDFLIPFATGAEDWRWERIMLEEDSGEKFALTLLKAATAFPDSNYRDEVNKLKNLDADQFASHRAHLLFST